MPRRGNEYAEVDLNAVRAGANPRERESGDSLSKARAIPPSPPFMPRRGNEYAEVDLNAVRAGANPRERESGDSLSKARAIPPSPPFMPRRGNEYAEVDLNAVYLRQAKPVESLQKGFAVLRALSRRSSEPKSRGRGAETASRA